MLKCPDVKLYKPISFKYEGEIVELNPPLYSVRPMRARYDAEPGEAIVKAYGRLLRHCRGIEEERRREEIRRLKARLSPEERWRLTNLIITLKVPPEHQLGFIRDYVKGRVKFKVEG